MSVKIRGIEFRNLGGLWVGEVQSTFGCLEVLLDGDGLARRRTVC